MPQVAPGCPRLPQAAPGWPGRPNLAPQIKVQRSRSKDHVLAASRVWALSGAAAWPTRPLAPQTPQPGSPDQGPKITFQRSRSGRQSGPGAFWRCRVAHAAPGAPGCPRRPRRPSLAPQIEVQRSRSKDHVLAANRVWALSGAATRPRLPLALQAPGCSRRPRLPPGAPGCPRLPQAAPDAPAWLPRSRPKDHVPKITFWPPTGSARFLALPRGPRGPWRPRLPQAPQPGSADQGPKITFQRSRSGHQPGLRAFWRCPRPAGAPGCPRRPMLPQTLQPGSSDYVPKIAFWPPIGSGRFLALPQGSGGPRRPRLPQAPQLLQEIQAPLPGSPDYVPKITFRRSHSGRQWVLGVFWRCRVGQAAPGAPGCPRRPSCPRTPILHHASGMILRIYLPCRSTRVWFTAL